MPSNIAGTVENGMVRLTKEQEARDQKEELDRALERYKGKIGAAIVLVGQEHERVKAAREKAKDPHERAQLDKRSQDLAGLRTVLELRTGVLQKKQEIEVSVTNPRTNEMPVQYKDIAWDKALSSMSIDEAMELIRADLFNDENTMTEEGSQEEAQLEHMIASQKKALELLNALRRTTVNPNAPIPEV